MNLIKILKFEEGFREKPYLCSEGFVTIGLGTKLHKSKGMNPEDFPITVSEGIAEEWLNGEVDVSRYRLNTSHVGSIFQQLSYSRRPIILYMAYQMGVDGVLNFNNMWAALENKDYTKASTEALDSKWARQTPERAMRHAKVLLTGDLEETYGRF